MTTVNVLALRAASNGTKTPEPCTRIAVADGSVCRRPGVTPNSNLMGFAGGECVTGSSGSGFCACAYVPLWLPVALAAGPPGIGVAGEVSWRRQYATGESDV